MKIAVVGTGYVGLVTGTCFAETGNHVTCIDIDENKVNLMKQGEVPIYEPGLKSMFEKNIRHNRLSFTTDLKSGIKNAQVIFLALPTPPGEDGSADLKYILGVAEELGKIIEDYVVIVDKSTVPVGTGDKVHSAVSSNAKVNFDIVSNPEFLREGVAIDDFMKPDRVVLGVNSNQAEKVMKQLYEPFVRQGNPIIFMDVKSAEMTKYAANAFLATKITFMNEIANLAEKVGANVDMVRKGIGTDTRIGKRFLFSGIGYGGSCFPKDVLALSKTAKENAYDFRMLEAVMAVNHDQKTKLFPTMEGYFKGDLKGKKIALWGLAFKPNTDDIREAPSLYMIDELLKAGAEVIAYDPEAMRNVKDILGDKISYVEGEYEALDDADALLIVTEWQVFRSPDFSEIKKRMKGEVIFDGRNLFNPNTVKEKGFDYFSIGRP
jgi:UDPglucose 6-dehydrogenase